MFHLYETYSNTKPNDAHDCHVNQTIIAQHHATLHTIATTYLTTKQQHHTTHQPSSTQHHATTPGASSTLQNTALHITQLHPTPYEPYETP